jgi:parvulin-like peptidyl-prolyl isomerase
MMYKILSIFLLLTMLVVINNCGLSEDTVAKVGNQEIKINEYKDALSQRFPGKENFTEIDSAAKMQVLNGLIDKKRKLAAAYDMNIDDEEEYEKAISEREDQAIFNKYIENMVVDSVIDLAKVEEYLEKIKIEVKASHILIRFGEKNGNIGNRTKEEAKAIAESLVQRIKNGESINVLAKEYSEDPSAKRNDGNLGYFTWGRMVNEFQDAAFNLSPGEVSEPVLTSYGYHVIQVEDRRDNPNYDPNNQRAAVLQIKRKLYSENQLKARKRWTENGKNVRNEFNYSINEQNIANLLTLAAEKNKADNLNENDFTDDEKKLVLAEFNGGKITVNDLFERYKNKFRVLLPMLKNLDKLKQEIENTATNDIIKIITDRENYNQDPDVQEVVEQAKEQQLLSMLNKKVAEIKTDFSDDELQSYYEEHIDQFKREGEIEIWEIFIKDQNTAKKVAKLAQSGQDFEKLENQYNEDKTTKKKKGYLGFRSIKRRGAVSQKAFEVGPNTIAGPIEYRKGWAVIKTGELKPEGIKPFDEVKNQVTQRLKQERIREKREEWNKKITDNYPAKINYTLLENI